MTHRLRWMATIKWVKCLTLALMVRMHLQNSTQVCVYQVQVVTNLGRCPNAYRVVANENWRCNLSTERNSTMDLVVGLLNGD